MRKEVQPTEQASKRKLRRRVPLNQQSINTTQQTSIAPSPAPSRAAPQPPAAQNENQTVNAASSSNQNEETKKEKRSTRTRKSSHKPTRIEKPVQLPFHERTKSTSSYERFKELNKLIADHEIKNFANSKVSLVADAVKQICANFLESLPSVMDKYYTKKVIPNPQNELNRLEEKRLLFILEKLKKEEEEYKNMSSLVVDDQLPESLVPKHLLEAAPTPPASATAHIESEMAEAVSQQMAQVESLGMHINKVSQMQDIASRTSQAVQKKLVSSQHNKVPIGNGTLGKIFELLDDDSHT